jgi:CheY-like chemotaxis protein/ribosomal protein S27AE
MQPQRILLADDSRVTRDLLKLLLTTRGHQVDLAEDGEEAFKALESNPYDLVLMDFHLPKMDGLQVTTAHRGREGAEKGPRFIAITADMEGLLAHAGNCETFDGVIPKPFDIERICAIIESSLEESEAPPDALEVKSAEPPTPRAIPTSAPVAAPRKQNAWDAKYRLLRWPSEFDPQWIEKDHAFDAILIESALANETVDALMQLRGLHLLPVIDMTGRLKSRADLDASRLGPGSEDRLDQLIAAFRERRRRVHPEILQSEDPGRKLLGRIFVSRAPLTPFYDPTTPELFSYNTTVNGLTVAREAERLYEDGLLRRSFFDRFHICPQCSSARHSVREKCVKCGSTHLDEAPYLHHFRCAHQGPEAEFRRARDLVCPKCTRHLHHLGEDYDRPGMMVTCKACRHSVAQSDIKFLCMDCGIHMDTEAIPVRDVFSYELTDKGISAVEYGPATFGGKSDPLQLVELPLELIIGLNGAVGDHKTQQTPFCVLDVSYRNTDQSEQGQERLTHARDALGQRLAGAVKAKATVIRGRARDFILMKATPPEEARKMLPSLREMALGQLPEMVGVEITVYGPQDFA